MIISFRLLSICFYCCIVLFLILVEIRAKENQNETNTIITNRTGSIHYDQDCYATNEPIYLSFVNNYPVEDDWVGIYPMDVDLQNLRSPRMWLRTCGTQVCRGSTEFATLKFADGEPEEGFLDYWPLNKGKYIAVLAKNRRKPPFEYIAISISFTVQKTCETNDSINDKNQTDNDPIMTTTMMPPLMAPPPPPPRQNDTTLPPPATTIGSKVRDLIQSLALMLDTQSMIHLNDPESYQSKALMFLEVRASINTLEGENEEEQRQEYMSLYVLACIYYSTHGVPNNHTLRDFPHLHRPAGWIRRDGWMSASDKCTWFGISCDQRGRIREIRLVANRLLGYVPPEIRFLKQWLQKLDLSHNYYLATEPTDVGNDWIGSLTELKSLCFRNTSLSYPGIPSFLGNLAWLEKLDVADSLYTQGPIREAALRGLTRLEYLDLSSNVYTTSFPSSVSPHLSSLAYLYMSHVQFVATAHAPPPSLDFLVELPAIFEFWADGTQFRGGIPSRIGQVQTLFSLSLTYCGLDGPIPHEMGNLSRLDRLWLSQNQLTGEIPSSLGKLKRLRTLFIEGNQLYGSMPMAICANTETPGRLADLGTDCTAFSTNGGRGRLIPAFVNCSCCSCCGVYQCLTTGGGP